MLTITGFEWTGEPGHSLTQIEGQLLGSHSTPGPIISWTYSPAFTSITGCGITSVIAARDS